MKAESRYNVQMFPEAKSPHFTYQFNKYSPSKTIVTRYCKLKHLKYMAEHESTLYLHRLDGPAYIRVETRSDGEVITKNEYWINGKEVTHDVESGIMSFPLCEEDFPALEVQYDLAGIKFPRGIYNEYNFVED